MPLPPARPRTRTPSAENRGTPADSAADPLRAAQREPENQQPDEAAQPHRTGGHVQPVEARVSPRGEVCAAWPAAPGTTGRPRRQERAARSPPAPRPTGARARGGRPTAPPRRPAQKSAKQSSSLRIARPNAVTPNRGTSAPTSNTERSESLAVAKSRYTGIAISRPAGDRECGRTPPAASPRDAPDHRTQDDKIRSTKSPIAIITVTNISQRVISSCGVVAVAEMLGTLELGRRPGVRSHRVRERPLHRVAVDRDRSPVDQVPALGQVGSQRHDQRVRIRRRAAHRAGRLLLAPGIGDRDDREPRLDRLVVGELDVRRRTSSAPGWPPGRS